MKKTSILLVIIMALFAISCSSDSDLDQENNAEETSKYDAGAFLSLYHGTPLVLANVVTGGTIEMDKWYELLSHFVDEKQESTRGPVGKVLSLVQFAGKCTVVCKDANLDIYMRLRSKGISYIDMYNSLEPSHRSGCANAEEWEIAMNQGKIKNPRCFADLATAYALDLEEDEGYNQYRYKIIANTSVVLAEEGVNVIASFDSNVSDAKLGYDFVNAAMSGDYETLSSKISGLINETGGDVSDAALYAFKAYLAYSLENRETSFTWIPKNNTYFSGYWYEKIDDQTEYQYDIEDENNIVDERMWRTKWQSGNENPLVRDTPMKCTLYCGKEYIFYIKENDKVTPYRIVHTAGDYVTSSEAFFYMIEVGGTRRRLWRRTPYYPHEQNNSLAKFKEELIGEWLYWESFDKNLYYNNDALSYSNTSINTLKFNDDGTYQELSYIGLRDEDCVNLSCTKQAMGTVQNEGKYTVYEDENNGMMHVKMESTMKEYSFDRYTETDFTIPKDIEDVQNPQLKKNYVHNCTAKKLYLTTIPVYKNVWTMSERMPQLRTSFSLSFSCIVSGTSTYSNDMTENLKKYLSYSCKFDSYSETKSGNTYILTGTNANQGETATVTMGLRQKPDGCYCFYPIDVTLDVDNTDGIQSWSATNIDDQPTENFVGSLCYDGKKESGVKMSCSYHKSGNPTESGTLDENENYSVTVYF